LVLTELDDLKEAFQRERSSVRENISSGICETLEEYKLLVGISEGLTKAINMVEDYQNMLVSGQSKED
jgi:hypothetical protein